MFKRQKMCTHILCMWENIDFFPSFRAYFVALCVNYLHSACDTMVFDYFVHIIHIPLQARVEKRVKLSDKRYKCLKKEIINC